MKRTKKEAEQTKDLILETALDIFSKKSYDLSTLNDIASASGLTRGAIYWHFQDKTDILKELTHIHLGEFLNKIKVEFCNREGNSLDKIGSIFKLYFEYFLDNESNLKFIRIIYGKMSFNDSNPFVLEIFGEIINTILNDLNKTIALGQANNEIRKDLDVSYLTTVILSLIVRVDKIINFYPRSLKNREEVIKNTLIMLKA